MLRWLTAACLLCSTVVAAQPGARSDALDWVGQLPIVFHIATNEGELVADEALLARYLRVTNGHYAPAGVGFFAHEVRALPEGHAVLENNRDRRRLRRYLEPRVINVFVVAEILDPNPSGATRRAASNVGREPSGRLAGAHIPAPGRTPATYVIVNARASELSVTHEVGHFLGMPHSGDPTNIMSYGARRDGFDASQLEHFHRRARRLLRRRTLRPVRRGPLP